MLDGQLPSLVFMVRVVPKKRTDVPMMTTRFTCSSRHQHSITPGATIVDSCMADRMRQMHG